MFDWLKDLFKWLREELNPCVTVSHYERGVRLRFGKPKKDGDKYRTLQPGLHWKIPLVDDIHTAMVKPTTIDLTEQTITTYNNVQLVIECSIKYEIVDAAYFLLEVAGAVEALADQSKGIIRRELSQYSWPFTNAEGLNTSEEIEKQILKKLKKEATQWGLRVIQLNIATLAPMRSIRLLQTYAYKTNEQK